MTRCCEVCKQPIPEDEVYEVVFRNRLIAKACLWCWLKWPDDWKLLVAYRLEHV